MFWVDIVKPMLCVIEAKQLLEIGADRGEHTHFLLQYCDEFNAHLTVIEPFVKQSLKNIIENSDRARLIAEKSQRAISHVNTPVDAVLLEGDLNYQAVYNDLFAIHNLSLRQGVR